MHDGEEARGIDGRGLRADVDGTLAFVERDGVRIGGESHARKPEVACDTDGVIPQQLAAAFANKRRINKEIVEFNFACVSGNESAKTEWTTVLLKNIHVKLRKEILSAESEVGFRYGHEGIVVAPMRFGTQGKGSDCASFFRKGAANDCGFDHWCGKHCNWFARGGGRYE